MSGIVFGSNDSNKVIFNGSGNYKFTGGLIHGLSGTYIPAGYDISWYYVDNEGDYDLGNPDKLDTKHCKKCGVTVDTFKVCCPYCEEYYFDR